MTSKQGKRFKSRCLAEVLAKSGRLSEAESRGIGSRIVAALLPIHEQGLAHGDLRASNVVIAVDDEICFSDDAVPANESNPNSNGSPENLSALVRPAQRADIIAVALLVAQCATGVVLDPSICWSRFSLARLGCSTELARDVAAVLGDPSDLRSALTLINDANSGSTAVTPSQDGNQLAPTVSIESTAIAGLPPLVSTSEAFSPRACKVSWQDALRAKIEHWLAALRRTIRL